MVDTKPAVTDDEALKLCQDPGAVTKDFIFPHTMLRIKDPTETIPFYTGILGMQLLQKVDFPDMKFSLYFMGYANRADLVGDWGTPERSMWVLQQKASLEFTHNWGTEHDPNFKYHSGNTDPRGYGHIAIMVPDVKEACDRFEKLGVKFIKRLQDGTMKTIAHIADPDGYWIEIFNYKNI